MKNSSELEADEEFEPIWDTPAAKVSSGSRPVPTRRRGSKRPTSQKGRKTAQPKRIERPFPRITLEEALRVPLAIKEKNAGNPFASEDVATALAIGAKGTQFFYLSAAARDYGLTVGTRDSEKISLTELGRTAVYPASPKEAYEAKITAFQNIDVFRRVVEHYKGSNLPEMQYLSNTLTREFGIVPELHDDFVGVFAKNCDYLNIKTWPLSGAEASDGGSIVVPTPGPAVVTLGQSKTKTGLLCFVIMPFKERESGHADGFFQEVLDSLIVPAATDAGFTVRSARRQGSDVIQQTIVSDLLQADLVVADLTEHNPNVMFELGMRMAQDKPIALVRAKGTGGIFDVDNMLRVYDYDPNLWRSTIERDTPAIKDHISATWANRDTDITYMKLLGRAVKQK